MSGKRLWIAAAVAAALAAAAGCDRSAVSRSGGGKGGGTTVSGGGGAAGKRVALVIGNNEYEYVAPLSNAVGDAQRLTEALEELGFEVEFRKNRAEKEAEEDVREFLAKLDGGDWAWFYFAGHGVQVDGKSYLLPVDFEVKEEAAVEYDALSADSVREELEKKAKLRVLVLDACRDTPIFPPPPGKRSLVPKGTGLAKPLEEVDGTLIAYATGAGNVADDGGYGDSGLYMQCLLPELKKEKVELTEAFENARKAAYKASSKKQNPAIYNQVFEDICLRGECGDKENDTTTTDPCKGDQEGREERDWDAVKNSKSRAVLETYIERHKEDPCAKMYVGLAKERIAEQEWEDVRESEILSELAEYIERWQSTAEAEDFVGEAQDRLAELTRPGGRFRDDCAGCPQMVVIPAGSFMMGSPESEEGRDDDEGPEHQVEIGEPFAVGAYEVTRDEYGTFVSETGHAGGTSCWVYTGGEWKEREGADWRNPGYSQTGRDPVACVNWEDAQKYVEWLRGKTGEEYRLLSEAEWEYAARAGSGTRYSFGDDISPNDANYGNIRKTQPVGSYRANGYGLYDMHGNVWEWVEDCWNDNYEGAPTDGKAWKSGDCSRRVLRGGSWSDLPRGLRAAYRFGLGTGIRISVNGFRLARTLAP